MDHIMLLEFRSKNPNQNMRQQEINGLIEIITIKTAARKGLMIYLNIYMVIISNCLQIVIIS
mgnify:FL=1